MVGFLKPGWWTEDEAGEPVKYIMWIMIILAAVSTVLWVARWLHYDVIGAQSEAWRIFQGISGAIP